MTRPSRVEVRQEIEGETLTLVRRMTGADSALPFEDRPQA